MLKVGLSHCGAFQKQITFLKDALFANDWNHFERLGLATYSDTIKTYYDFATLNSLATVQTDLSGLRYFGQKPSWRKFVFLKHCALVIK